MKTDMYNDKLEDKNYSGSGVYNKVKEDGAVVTSINDKTGDVYIGINSDGNGEDNFIDLGISGDRIPLTSPTSADDVIPSVHEAVETLIEGMDSLSTALENKHSIDTVEDQQVTDASLQIKGSSGISATVASGETQSIITIGTHDSVPKKFVVDNSQNVVASEGYPYKFISSDQTISITKTDTAGEINLRALDTPTDSKFMFSEPLTTLNSKLMIGYQPTQNYFSDGNLPFDFTVKLNTSLYPQTTDLILTAYYSDYIQRNPTKFPNNQGIFLVRGVPTANPDGDLVNMFRIYIDVQERNGEAKHDLMITAHNPTTGALSKTVRLNTDLPTTDTTGPKVSLNLSQIWAGSGYSLKSATFHKYSASTPITPFEYSLVCGHIYFSFQYLL